MREKSKAEIAQIAVDNLFGDYDRLVCSRSGEDTGRSGWSKRPIIDRIESALAAAQSTLATAVLDRVKKANVNVREGSDDYEYQVVHNQGVEEADKRLRDLFSRLGIKVDEQEENDGKEAQR